MTGIKPQGSSRKRSPYTPQQWEIEMFFWSRRILERTGTVIYCII